MSDYIKRENAIKAIKKDIMGGLNYESILNRLPSADVAEVKHAEDVGYEDSYGWVSKCSLCGAEFHEPTHGANYCPNCGAKMDGERKE